MDDILIIGGGPAGLSAAINTIARGGRCTVVSNPVEENPLWPARQVDNYPGMAGSTGAEILEKMHREAEEAGVTFVTGRCTAILPFGDTFAATVGEQMLTARRLILAIGAGAGVTMPGETEFLGRGVSYCATCDGRLYRGRRVLVTGNAGDLAEEAAFLQSVGAQVTVVTRRPVKGLDAAIPALQAKDISLWQEEGKLLGLTADGDNLPADGVFVLRQVTVPTALLPGLETDGRFITVDRQMRTNIPGCYAVGDCTGFPLQIAKAVGEGLVAAQYAMKKSN